MAVDKDKYISTAMQLEAVQKENDRLRWENERLRDHWATEKAKAEAYMQLDEANKATIYAVVAAVGATKEQPLRIDIAVGARARAQGLEVGANVDPETGEYLLYQ